MAVEAVPEAAAEAAEITYGHLRVTTPTRGCSCCFLFRSTNYAVNKVVSITGILEIFVCAIKYSATDIKRLAKSR